MKTGDAILMAVMEEISEDIENFSGNLIFCGVCDEEANSGGDAVMRSGARKASGRGRL